jgi:hypothetical protein
VQEESKEDLAFKSTGTEKQNHPYILGSDQEHLQLSIGMLQNVWYSAGRPSEVTLNQPHNSLQLSLFRIGHRQVCVRWQRRIGSGGWPVTRAM